MKNQLLLYFISLLFTTSIIGQDQITLASRTIGFSGGVHAAYISYENDGFHAETETGFGYGVIAEYGFNHKIAVAVSYQHYSITPKSTNSTVDKYPLNEYDIVGKYIFGSTNSKLRPNVQVGFNFTDSEEEFYYETLGPYTDVFTTEEYYGTSFLAGAGLSYFFTSNVSADLSFLVHIGQFTTGYVTSNYTPTEKIDITSDFFNLNGLLGVKYHF